MKIVFAFIAILFLNISGFSVIPKNQDAAATYICPPCGDGVCDQTIYDQPGICTVCGMTLIKKENLRNVAIFIHDGVELLDFSGPGEVFAATHSDTSAFNVYTVSLTTEPITSQGFVKIIPQYSIEDAPVPDILVLPGGNTGSVSNNPHLLDWIKKIAPDLEVAMSVCTGAFILEKAGLLAGKKATTWHGAIDRFRAVATDTEVMENVRWVDNGQIITTAGVSAGIDGALHVVERLLGREAAAGTARYMEYDKWKPEEGLTTARN